MSTTLANMERPGRKPRWDTSIHSPRRGSHRCLNAFASNRFAVSTMHNGRVASAAYTSPCWAC
eukprot:7568-Lingulodinium_polyedra.AAC.1